MEKLRKIVVFNAFSPYLHILMSYKSDNFRSNNPILIVKNSCIAVGLMVSLALLPISIGLTIWGLIDKSAAMRNVVIAIPLLITFSQMFMKFVTLILESCKVNATIGQLQRVVDQRE